MVDSKRTAIAIGLLLAVCVVAYMFLKGGSSSAKSEDTSSAKVFSAPAQTEMKATLPAGETPVSQGGFGAIPWGSGSKFIDPTATWLWSQTNARFSAPPATLEFSALITNSSKTEMPVVIHVLVDNDCELYLNDRHVGSASMGFSTQDYSKIPVSIPWGTNIISFRCTNTGNSPAGFIAAVVDAVTGVTLLKTDPSVFVFERLAYGQTK